MATAIAENGNERMKLTKRADIETTYNAATKQHGLKGIAKCSKCGQPYELHTTNPEIFNTGRCLWRINLNA